MISIEMTVAEMLDVYSRLGVSTGLKSRIAAALELAVKSESNTTVRYRFNLLDYNANRKIPVIKEVRMAFSWGLREAKDWVENANPDNHTWSTTPWMSRDSARILRDNLRAMDCACSDLIDSFAQP